MVIPVKLFTFYPGEHPNTSQIDRVNGHIVYENRDQVIVLNTLLHMTTNEWFQAGQHGISSAKHLVCF